MPATPDDLFALLDRLAHRAPDRDAIRRCSRSSSRGDCAAQIPGGHTKNLFLKDKKGALFLVTAEEDAVIELKSLHRRLGASGRFSFGSADLLRETLGIEPGAVTPFAAMNDTGRAGDGGARRRPDGARDASTAHPLRNTMTTSIARDDLVKFLEATGHPPRIVAVAETTCSPCSTGSASRTRP